MPPTPTQTRAEFDDEEALHYRGILRRLVDIAMHEASSMEGEPGTQKPDRSVRLERIARTIRRNILLARKLAEPLPTPRPLPNHGRPILDRPTQDRTTARKRILREVGDAIYRTAEDADVESLETELLDRLDTQELEDDIARRPLAEIIADIARDLGVGTSDPRVFDWKRRTPEDIEALNLRAQAPLPAEPPPPKPASARVPAWRPELPDDPRQAVAMLLQLTKPPNR